MRRLARPACSGYDQLYAATDDWGSAGAGLPDPIHRAATELAPLIRESARRHQVHDPFTRPTNFSPAG